MDFARIALTAQRLLSQNGRAVTVVRLGRTPTDINKPWRGSATPRADAEVEYSVVARCVFVEPYSLIRYGFTATDVEDMRRFDVVIIFSAQDFVDAGVDAFGMSDIVDGSTSFSVGLIRQLKPGDVPLLYVIGAKR